MTWNERSALFGKATVRQTILHQYHTLGVFHLKTQLIITFDNTAMVKADNPLCGRIRIRLLST